jgi:hypothetical protein
MNYDSQGKTMTIIEMPPMGIDLEEIVKAKQQRSLMM